jgi:hypothetical protein
MTTSDKGLRGGLTKFLDDVFDAVGEIAAAAKVPEDSQAQTAKETRPVDTGLARQVIGDAQLTLARLLRKDDIVYLPLLDTRSGWVIVDIDPALSSNNPEDVVVTGTVMGRFDGHVQRSWILALDTIMTIRPRKKTA